MKKYLLGISAIALAIAFSAFTKPFANEQLFRIKAGVDKTNEAAVESLSNWERIVTSSASCYSNNTDEQVCEIYVSDIYYTATPDGFGGFVYSLNTTDPDGAGPKLQMVINADDGSLPSPNFDKIVVVNGSTITSRHNRDLP